jgi:hypothetical protein
MRVSVANRLSVKALGIQVPLPPRYIERNRNE